MPLRSQTWTELRRLFNELPAKRVRLLGVVLVASFLQGLMDVALVGMMTRLAGLMAGGRLQDQLPGVRVFGGGVLDQAGWLIALLIAAFWIASVARFGVALLQSFLSAEIWNDLVNKVYRNLMLQRYEFFADNRTANLAESFNRVLNRVSNSVITPLLAVAGNALSVSVACGSRSGNRLVGGLDVHPDAGGLWGGIGIRDALHPAIIEAESALLAANQHDFDGIIAFHA